MMINDAVSRTDYNRVCDMHNQSAARADALAAEVERLTAELQNTTVDRDMALSYADVLKNGRDALRAQLDAGEGWRKSKDVRPEDRQRVYNRTTTIAIYHAEDGYFHVDGVYGWYESEWRPAPPQE